MEAFGVNELRGAIIRTLAQHPEGMTSGQIERELDAAYQTVFRHLKTLVAAGVVTVDGDEVRQGQRSIYRIDLNVVNQALMDYRRYLLGAEGSH